MVSNPKRRRLEPAARYQEIIATATSLIAKSGYYGISLQKVADGCGITKAGLLHYFSSKDALLIAVLEARDKADTETLHLISPPRPISKSDTREFLNRLVERNASQREIVRLFTVLSAEALNLNHPAHDYFSTRTHNARSNVEIYASEWHPDSRTFTIELFSFLDGLQLLWLRDEDVDLTTEWHKFADLLFS